MKVEECVVGARSGRLTVLRTFKDGRYTRAECQCDCGNKCSPITTNISPSKQVSCGCYFKEKMKEWRPRTHGQSNRKKPTSEYWAWGKMKQRCLNQDNQQYAGYGARGIFICDRWRDSFEAFYEDMGSKPSPLHSIDRINNNDGYYKENCRWATDVEQMGNRRCSTQYMFNGKLMSIEAINREVGFKKGTLCKRINRGWSFEKAISTPISEKHSIAAMKQFLKAS